VTGKRWVSILDATTRVGPRADHAGMNGTKTGYNADFEVAPTGDPAPYPRHWGLPAAQRVNCRCRTISVIPEFEAEDDGWFDALNAEFG